MFYSWDEVIQAAQKGENVLFEEFSTEQNKAINAKIGKQSIGEGGIVLIVVLGILFLTRFYWWVKLLIAFFGFVLVETSISEGIKYLKNSKRCPQHQYVTFGIMLSRHIFSDTTYTTTTDYSLFWDRDVTTTKVDKNSSRSYDYALYIKDGDKVTCRNFTGEAGELCHFKAGTLFMRRYPGSELYLGDTYIADDINDLILNEKTELTEKMVESIIPQSVKEELEDYYNCLKSIGDAGQDTYRPKGDVYYH